MFHLDSLSCIVWAIPTFLRAQHTVIPKLLLSQRKKRIKKDSSYDKKDNSHEQKIKSSSLTQTVSRNVHVHVTTHHSPRHHLASSAPVLIDTLPMVSFFVFLLENGIARGEERVVVLPGRCRFAALPPRGAVACGARIARRRWIEHLMTSHHFQQILDVLSRTRLPSPNRDQRKKIISQCGSILWLFNQCE